MKALFSASLTAMALACHSASAATAAAPDVTGTWSGQAVQVNREKPFQVVMGITAKGGEIRYPESNCSGTLTRAGTSGDYVFFVEKITVGAYDPAKKTGCIAGSISVQKVGAGVVWGWVGSFEGRPIIVYATLGKTGPAPGATPATPAKTTTTTTTPPKTTTTTTAKTKPAAKPAADAATSAD